MTNWTAPYDTVGASGPNSATHRGRYYGNPCSTQIVEVVKLIPRERVQNRTVEHNVNVLVPCIQHEIVELLQLFLQEHISVRIVEQIKEHIVLIAKAIPHELIEQLVDVPVHQMERVVQMSFFLESLRNCLSAAVH